MIRRIVVLGKGGVGKSTIAAQLATLLCREGKRVLKIGCDPKHDSSLLNGPDGSVRTVMEDFVRRSGKMGPEHLRELIVSTGTGVDVVEAGGPEPGKGCAGRAVSVVLDIFARAPEIFDAYDVVFYDVLGDVVCGGFAAPLREEHASDVILVASRDFMSLYAANNIAQGICSLAELGGARVIGVVANRVRDDAEIEVIERFAVALGCRLLGAIPLSDEFLLAEVEGTPLLNASSQGSVADAYGQVLRRIEETTDETRVVPRPLSEDAIRMLYRDYLRRASAGISG